MDAITSVEILNNGTLIVKDDLVEIVTDLVQGPQGPPGATGPMGPAGASGAVTATAVQALSGHRMIKLDSSGGADYVSNTVLADAGKVFGMTSGAVSAGAEATIITAGNITEPSWNWTVNQPVYLGANGTLTQTMPVKASAEFVVVVGIAVAATTLFINIGMPIVLV